jgi:hypothetical protein
MEDPGPFGGGQPGIARALSPQQVTGQGQIHVVGAEFVEAHAHIRAAAQFAHGERAETGHVEVRVQ